MLIIDFLKFKLPVMKGVVIDQHQPIQPPVSAVQGMYLSAQFIDDFFVLPEIPKKIITICGKQNL
jgi:hypothetical protein